MRKLLLLATIISTTALAETPFPEACENFITASEEAFDIALKEDPTKKEEIEKMRSSLSHLKDEWQKTQAMEDNLRKASEEMVTKICEQGLEHIKKTVEEHKAQQ